MIPLQRKVRAATIARVCRAFCQLLTDSLQHKFTVSSTSVAKKMSVYELKLFVVHEAQWVRRKVYSLLMVSLLCLLSQLTHHIYTKEKQHDQ
jgi:hypothetical protein